LLIDLVEVDPDNAAGPPHTVARQFSIGDQSAHRPITDLQVISSLLAGDVSPSHHDVDDLNLPSFKRDSRSMRMAIEVPIRRASSCSWATILRISFELTW
jgi:hypothetical protein